MNDLLQWPTAQYWNRPWNPVIGCIPISPACEHCYARTLVKRFNMTGVEDAGRAFFPKFKGKLKNPPRKGVVFCGNMTDLFGNWVEESEMRDWIGMTLGHAYTATYLWLTKRVENMCRVLDQGRVFLKGEDDADFRFSDCEMRNQFFGFTAENQACYDERFEIWRRKAPRWVNGWVSIEPMLGPIDLKLGYAEMEELPYKWIVVGCESGPQRRQCELAWIEDVVHQAVSHGVRVFVRQLNINGKCETDILKFPHHLQVRQVPWEEWHVVSETVSAEESIRLED